MTERNLSCIVCPIGCSLKVTIDDNNNISVTGNTCPRGAKYAEAECTNPERTITTTIKAEGGSVVSVKTDRPIPKSKMTECMQIINKTVVKLPVNVGDILIEDVFGSNIVATKNL